MDIARLHFLLAHADSPWRRAVAEQLGQLGATRITEVSDGHSVLRWLQDSDISDVDIAILDLELPGIDGLALIRRLAGAACRSRLIIAGEQPEAMMFSIETMAQAYGMDLLGTLGTLHDPVNAARLGVLIDNFSTPPAATLDQAELPRMSALEVAAGLQARQFEPFFQPKIELESGRVKGLETFARWRHPQHGVMGPASFMQALEAQQRMDFLDWPMIEGAVERCAALHAMGILVAISVNLAPRTLAHPHFMQQIRACIARHRLQPPFLTFEIPESSVLSADASFVERLVRMRIAGFGLAIDDYGTSRSNLQLLARIPFSELKIDRSFVDGASKNRALGTVLSSCLGLARSLGRDAVAVGVETRQDWEFLQGLGCTYAQGFYIASPMEAGAFPGWLEDWLEYF
jgi:EAL domain-containing protein (putative c-di-GMP-specific phosphodiesterase class I)